MKNASIHVSLRLTNVYKSSNIWNWTIQMIWQIFFCVSVWPCARHWGICKQNTELSLALLPTNRSFWRLMFYEDFHKIFSGVWFHPRKGGVPPGYPYGEKGRDAQRCGGWEDGDRVLADSRTLHRWLGKNGMWTKLFLSCYHFPSCKLPHAGHYSRCSQALSKTFHGFENSTVFLTLVQLDHFGISDLVADVSPLGSYDSCLLFSRLPLHSDQRSPFLAAQGRCGPSFPRSPLLQNLGPGCQAPMSFYFYFPNSLLSVSKPSVFCPQITFFPP